LGLQM